MVLICYYIALKKRFELQISLIHVGSVARANHADQELLYFPLMPKACPHPPEKGERSGQEAEKGE